MIEIPRKTLIPNEEHSNNKMDGSDAALPSSLHKQAQHLVPHCRTPIPSSAFAWLRLKTILWSESFARSDVGILTVFSACGTEIEPSDTGCINMSSHQLFGPITLESPWLWHLWWPLAVC